MADIFAKITAFFQKFLALIKALFSGKKDVISSALADLKG